MKYNKIILLAGVLLSFLMSSCEEEDLMGFEADTAVNFIQKEQTYSFLGNNEDTQTIEIPVQIMGNAVDYDRSFNAQVIADSSNAAADSYEIIGGIVKAGEYAGNLLVEVQNSSELSDSVASIFLELTDSQDFSSGNIESLHYRLNWTDKVVVPAWTYYRYFFTSVPSTAAYRAIVQSTGITSFTISDYLALGPIGAQAVATKFGDYVKQWNLDHPNNPLIHDDGPQEGELIVPLYYTKSLYD